MCKKKFDTKKTQLLAYKMNDKTKKLNCPKH